MSPEIFHMLWFLSGFISVLMFCKFMIKSEIDPDNLDTLSIDGLVFLTLVGTLFGFMTVFVCIIVACVKTWKEERKNQLKK